MKSFIWSSWVSGLRGRNFQIVFMIGVFVVGIAYLSAAFSPRQPQTVALDVGLSGLRFSLTLMSLFWVQELVGREIDRRSVVLVLAYPIGRGTYLLGRLGGIAILLATAALILALLLWLAVLLNGGYVQARPVALGWPYWLTVMGIWLDVMVVATFALLMASLSTVLMLPLAMGLVFSIACHTLGPVIEYLARQADGQAEISARYGPIVGFVRWIVPDLSHLDWRLWTLYDLPPDYGIVFWSVLMAIGYAMVMFGLAVYSFERREFS